MTLADLFPDYPDQARLWVYVSDEPMSAGQQTALLSQLRQFFRTWHSHGRPVTAEAEILDARVLLVAGYVIDGDVSGCGIDESVRALDDAARAQHVTWESPLNVHFRDVAGVIRSVDRPTFREMARRDEIDESTIVFDLSTNSVGALRAGALERPVAASWHARLIGRPTSAPAQQL